MHSYTDLCLKYVFFFQIQFHLDIGAKSNFASGKSSKNKFEFEVKVERNKKYLFRVGINSLIC